jgi:hypothetical protein
VSARLTCALCGKPALYVWPPAEGRCREHRDVATSAMTEARVRYDAKAGDIEAEQAALDRALRERRKLRARGCGWGVRR